MKQTPEEKAKELYDKFYYQISTVSINMQMAITSALICVDEIIKANPCIENEDVGEHLDTMVCNKGYWQQVKQELQKM